MAAEMLIAGKLTKELFEYNRKNYQFDNMQVLQRDLLRLEMQVKRFELFREDIRDLVELTVGKMEMYHLVGALFLEFCVAFYVEGKIETTEVPPFSIALYYLSVAGAFLYLVLAVWLSMHASISSHSFGVRLLTRYVRLPIPSAEQMKGMNPTLAQFEREAGALRIPLVMEAQKWKAKHQDSSLPALPDETGPATTSTIHHERQGHDYLEDGEAPYIAGEKGIMKAAPKNTIAPKFGGGGQHVSLFRNLQAKWQCFDAYARVSMSLGAQMILMSVTCYLINVCLVEYRCPTACWALIVVFQTASLALVFLDVAGMRRWVVVLIWLTGTTPCILAAVALSHEIAINHGKLDPNESYPLSPLCFFFMVIWLESLLHVAWPSKDEATLPRRFRAVLFLDVFGDFSNDPTDSENDATIALPRISSERNAGRLREHAVSEKNVNAADEACDIAHMAMRRWETLPDDMPEISGTLQQVRDMRRDFTFWRKALANAIANGCERRHFPRDMLKDEAYFTKKHFNLNEEERSEDAFDGKYCGPITTPAQPGKPARTYFWDADQQKFLAHIRDGETVLNLEEVRGFVRDAEERVRRAIGDEKSIDVQARIDSGGADDENDGLEEPSRACACFRRAWRTESRGYYSTQRLPWKVLLWGTRCLQIAWLFQGVVVTGSELSWWKIDYSRIVNNEGDGWGDNHEGRRLRHEGEWFLEHLDVSWPRGDFFRTEGPMSCLRDHEGEAAVLLLGTAHELHLARPSNFSSTFMTMQPLSAASYPAGSVAMCGPRENGNKEIGASCLLAVLRPENVLKMWAFGSDENAAAEIRVERPAGRLPWQLVAGVAIICDAVDGMLVGAEEDGMLLSTNDKTGGTTSWCLLLAGWDGGRGVSVAAVPLRGGPGTLPAHGFAVVPVFDLPLPSSTTSAAALASSTACLAEGPSCSGRAVEVVALHMDSDTGRGRLWALLSDNTLAAWEAATPPRSLGRWTLSLPHDDSDIDATTKNGFAGRDFRATGMCEFQAGSTATRPAIIDSTRSVTSSFDAEIPNLFIVGRSGSGRPSLLKASMFEDLEDHLLGAAVASPNLFNSL